MTGCVAARCSSTADPLYATLYWEEGDIEGSAQFFGDVGWVLGKALYMGELHNTDS